MKKYIFIMLFFVSTTCLSQRYIVQDVELTPILKQFIKDGEKRNLYYANILQEKLLVVEFADLVYPTLGRYSRANGTIQIERYIQMDPTLLKLIMYHELAHVVKGDNSHSCLDCNDIMSALSSKGFSYYYQKGKMEQEIDKLFEWLDN